MTRIVPAITLAALVVPFAVSAASVPSFSEVDTNGDGRISLQEAKQAGVPASQAQKADFDDDETLNSIDWAWIERWQTEGRQG